MIRWVAPLVGTLGLVLLAGALVLVAARTLHDVAETPAHSKARMPLARPTDAPVVLLAGRRPAVYFAASTDRPLFAPGRRPGTGPAKPPPAPREPVPSALTEQVTEVQLLGTIVMEERASALLAIGNQPPSWIAVGTVIACFKLSGVGPDWAELAFDTNVLRLDLYPQ